VRTPSVRLRYRKTHSLVIYSRYPWTGFMVVSACTTSRQQDSSISSKMRCNLTSKIILTTIQVSVLAL
jgi:hypothetical protein